MWIFGYGSLVWRPAFPFVERSAAYVDGWSRRFWQGSTDHRGVPGRPGRVVTLVAAPGARCWGMAYRVRPGDLGEVLSQLDRREQGGYERREVTLWLRSGTAAFEPGSGLLYLATARNRNYLGPAPLEEIAAQVRIAHGPSGSNLEYVLALAKALREIGDGGNGDGRPRVRNVDEHDDDHAFVLERLLLSSA